ncbi:hypothetical protein KKE06_00860, partial [Candidatus Micrarchaeota archaeon]|nr:hypothetical protein [Candidatus Micrarchaeota archaeon]MBU1930449.1 hypothetical protein [Candidatus Micrarchaeota archaeon]
MVKKKAVLDLNARANMIEQCAIRLIPAEINGFLENVPSWKTGFLLAPREFEHIFRKANESEI